MKTYFTKYKSTSDFFYKKINNATVERFEDRFEITTYPIFHYSSIYYIDSILENTVDSLIFRTMKCYYDEPLDWDNFNSLNEHFVKLNKLDAKISIYNRDSKGIILK